MDTEKMSFEPKSRGRLYSETSFCLAAQLAWSCRRVIRVRENICLFSKYWTYLLSSEDSLEKQDTQTLSVLRPVLQIFKLECLSLV